MIGVSSLETEARTADGFRMNGSCLYTVRFGRVLGLLALLVAGSAGCDRDGLMRAPVEGIVNVDGKPLAAGTIRFVPAGPVDGPTAKATITNGTFELDADDGPILGTNRVMIEATSLYTPSDDERGHPVEDPEDRAAAPRNPLPDRYNRASMYAVNVTAQFRNSYEFELFTHDGK